MVGAASANGSSSVSADAAAAAAEQPVQPTPPPQEQPAQLALPLQPSGKGCAAEGCSRLDAQKKCGQCKRVFYCSTNCQKRHWKAAHKRFCKNPEDPQADFPVIHVLIPCHISNERGLLLFKHCLNSVAAQCASGFMLRIGLSGSDALRQQARELVDAEFSGRRPDISVTVVDSGEQVAQFIHFRSLIEDLPPHDMVMFLDADDMFHHRRVLVFQQHAMNRDCQPFSVLAKIISSAADTADLATVLSNAGDYQRKTHYTLKDQHVTGPPDEYVDWCTDVRSLQDFFRMTPQQICESRYCDLRFDVFLQERLWDADDSTTVASNQQWLYFYRKSDAPADIFESHVVRQLYLRQDEADIEKDFFKVFYFPTEDKRLHFKATLESIASAFDERQRELNCSAKAERSAQSDAADGPQACPVS